MRSQVKIQGKKLLSSNTLRLFSISVASFLLKSGFLAFSVFSFYYVLSRGTDSKYIAVPVFLSVLTISVISALSLGEKTVYFVRAQGSRGRFLLLFKFFKPKEILKATLFRIYILLNKTGWFLYFISPCVLASALIYYLYKKTVSERYVLIILSAGALMLFLLGFFCWRCACKRLSASDLYYITDGKRRIRKAVKKSIEKTDGALLPSVLSECSFIGWFFSCVALIPLVYVLPYCKLCGVLFTLEAIEGKHISKGKYPVCFTAYKSAP